MCACVHSPSRLGLRQVRRAPARLHWYSRVLTRSESRAEDKKGGRNEASPGTDPAPTIGGVWYENCEERLGAGGHGSARAGIRKQTLHAGEAARPRRPFGAWWPGRPCAAPRKQTLGYSQVLNEVLAQGCLLLGTVGSHTGAEGHKKLSAHTWYMTYSESSHGVHGGTPSTHQGRLSRLWHQQHQASLQRSGVAWA